MTYQILFSDLAFRQLKKLEVATRERIIASLERIRVRPETYLKKLVGDEGFRLRAGDYRVIVELDNEKLIVLVLRIGHRKKYMADVRNVATRYPMNP